MGSKSKNNTASRCTTEMETGTHTFEIVGHSLKKGIGVGNFVRSSTFTVGGHDWTIRFYPDGITASTRGFSTVSLELMATDAQVRAFYVLLLVNEATGLSETVMCAEPGPIVFRPSNYFIARESKLENGYIVDDCLTIECHLSVIKESQLLKTMGFGIQVPPSDLRSIWAGCCWMKIEEGADVVFSVRGETFPVHKIMLATRSPVFRAELYGQMMEGKVQRVTVEDMQPDVFRGLLHFIYTDALPAAGDDLAAPEDYREMIRHLLVAADRYAMDRLKLLCASVLVQNIDVDNVMTTFALANQHNYKSLKDVCIEFMAPSDKMDAVVTTQGYADIKRTCPSIIDDVEEKTRKYRKAKFVSY